MTIICAKLHYNQLISNWQSKVLFKPNNHFFLWKFVTSAFIGSAQAFDQK